MIKGVHIGEWEGGRVGGGKGGREGEKYFLPYKRVLGFLRVCSLKPREQSYRTRNEVPQNKINACALKYNANP